MVEEIDFDKGKTSWIVLYSIPLYITHQLLPIYLISLKSEKLFVDGRMNVCNYTYKWTDISSIRSAERTQPIKHRTSLPADIQQYRIGGVHFNGDDDDGK